MSVAANHYINKASPLRSSLRKHKPANNSDGAPSSNTNNGANGRQKSPGRKTVSFCSDKKVSNVSDCLQIMQNGTEMIKLRTNVRQFRRVFSLDTDLAYIRWHPTNKKPHKARIAVDSIKEVRVGWNTELLRATENSGLGDIQEVCAFSIIYGSEYECLDLIALTPEDANMWVVGLMALSSGLNNTEGSASTVDRNAMATLRERWLISVFDEADTDHKGYISEKSAVRLIRSINKHLQTNRIKQKVKEASTSTSAAGTPTMSCAFDNASRGRIDCNQFVEIYRDVATRPEIYFLMVRYANKDYLSCQDLQLFLETEQGMFGVTRECCENIIDLCEPCPEAKENNCMTVDGFTNYLLSDANSIFDPAHQSVCQNMDMPLNRYFIATSYNTYLVEDQLKGPSSVDGYISALKRNCRYIELDVWEPNEEEEKSGIDEPMICHGGTLTSRLATSAALALIAELAFERSRYPLFIRLEIHLSVKWQQKLVSLLEEHLGSKLYRFADDSIDWTLPENVPTPKKLINKIILTGTCYTVPNPRGTAGCEEETGEVTEEDEGCDLMTGKARKEHRMDMCASLSRLIAPFAHSKHLRPENDFRIPNNVSARSHILSLTENDCLRLLHAQSATFGQTFCDYLMRVTPNIARVDSSNLNPQDFWNFGLNMVALNYQTPGLMMDLQEGKFSANGSCGFVLKPPIMFEDVFTPTEKMPFAPQVLYIKILSAQQLQRPRGSTAKGDSVDPFVVIEVFGIPADCAEERTKTVRNDSFNPNFDESFQFEVCMPELALVRFLLLDDDFIGDDFIGQFTIPFECLQSGYRHIPLLNNEGDSIDNSTIFVHIAVTNRRGGGKARKRGMSVKRKTTRVQTGIKMVGVKVVDDLFKAASTPLVEFIELRTQLESAMTAWQEDCGIGPTGSMRQGLRLIHSRVSNATCGSSPPQTPSSQNSNSQEENTSPSFSITHNDKNFPTVQTSGSIPESIQKSFGTLENLLLICERISNRLDDLQTSLNDAIAKVGEMNSDLPALFAEAALRSQKSTRAAESFAWNVRLLRTQASLMSKTQREVTDIIFQVIDTSKILGVFDQKAAKASAEPTA